MEDRTITTRYVSPVLFNDVRGEYRFFPLQEGLLESFFGSLLTTRFNSQERERGEEGEGKKGSHELVAQ